VVNLSNGPQYLISKIKLLNKWSRKKVSVNHLHIFGRISYAYVFK